MITCQGWLLHQDAVLCAAARTRSMVARATGFGRNARQENRALRRSSRTSIGSDASCVARDVMNGLSCCSPPLGRDLVERHVLVDADVAGEPQHTLGNDVAQDLVGAAGNAHRRRG